VDRGWQALSAALPAAAGTAPAAATAAHGAWSSVVVKVAAVVVLAGGAVWGGAQLLGSPETIPQVSSTHVAPLPPPPVAAPVVVPSVVEPEVAPTPLDSKPRAPRSAPSGSTLAEEGRLLASAHQLVQSGKAAQALAVLRDFQERYPRSVLAQEREVLTIEAWGANGDAAQAKLAAQRFLARHPQSPHRGRLERFLK
jgi:TolA-binding protein